jgi:hypothetical protein
MNGVRDLVIWDGFPEINGDIDNRDLWDIQTKSLAQHGSKHFPR